MLSKKKLLYSKKKIQKSPLESRLQHDIPNIGDPVSDPQIGPLLVYKCLLNSLILH